MFGRSHLPLTKLGNKRLASGIWTKSGRPKLQRSALGNLATFKGTPLKPIYGKRTTMGLGPYPSLQSKKPHVVFLTKGSPKAFPRWLSRLQTSGFQAPSTSEVSSLGEGASVAMPLEPARNPAALLKGAFCLGGRNMCWTFYNPTRSDCIQICIYPGVTSSRIFGPRVWHPKQPNHLPTERGGGTNHMD